MYSKIVDKILSPSQYIIISSVFYIQKVFKKSTLYVVRTDVNGNYRNSAPCKNCYSVINDLGIKRIIFSADEDKFTIVKTCEYNTEHISNGNRYLNMTDEEKRERRKKLKPTILIKPNSSIVIKSTLPANCKP